MTPVQASDQGPAQVTGCRELSAAPAQAETVVTPAQAPDQRSSDLLSDQGPSGCSLWDRVSGGGDVSPERHL